METTQCLIIGQGPAGLSAAIYTARAGVDTLVIGCDPKVAGDYEIDNYFGFDTTISGRELLERGRAQAQRFGAKLSCDKVVGVHHWDAGGDAGGFVIKTEKGEFATTALILASGVSRSRPSIPNLSAYEGKGVSYCVSCDGYFYRGRPVMVLGEGNYAANQALELLNYTRDVRVCTLGKPRTMSQEYQDRLRQENIPVLEQAVTGLSGQPALEGVTLADGSQVAVDGVFIALGEASSTDFAQTLGVTRNGNFIEVDREMKTNIEGVYAAGDCTGGFLQIAVAVGEGAQAAKSALTWLKAKAKKA